MPVIETERLFIRELNTGDAAFILELLNTPGWLKYIGNSKTKTLSDAEGYIARVAISSYQKNGFGLYATVLKDSSALAGICGLIKRDTLEDIDIGFGFLPQYEGKGFAFEAALACLKFAKAELGIERIVAITLESNHRSIKLLNKLGLSFEKMINLPGDKDELMLFATQQE